MNRETINLNIFEGIDSINSLGKEEDFEEEKIPKKENNNIKEEKKEEEKKEEEKNKEEKQSNKEQEKKEENYKKEEQIINHQEKEKEKKIKEEIINTKKEQNKEENKGDTNENEDEDEDDEEEEDEKIVVKEYKKIKKKLIYSLKDDTKFMLLPKEKMPSNKYFYFITFIIFTSISLISDIFSIIISKNGGQITFAIFAILFRLIFPTSYIITFKYEFEFILILHLIINNCLFVYGVLFIIYLEVHHRNNFSDVFLWFCYIFYYLSLAANFINIIFLYVKYYKVYISMTEDDLKYLKIFNKRNESISEIQLVEKKE